MNITLGGSYANSCLNKECIPTPVTHYTQYCTNVPRYFYGEIQSYNLLKVINHLFSYAIHILGVLEAEL